MVEAACRDYGFDCDFTSDNDLHTVVDQFVKHLVDKHGIKYERETITKYLLNK